MTPTPPRILQRWAIQCRPRHRGGRAWIVINVAPPYFQTREAARKAARRFRSFGLAAQAVPVTVTIAVREG